MPANRAESARHTTGKPCRSITPTPPRPPLPRAYSALCRLAVAGLQLASVDPVNRYEFARALANVRRASSRYVRTFDKKITL